MIKAFGRRLRELRLSKGMSQEELGHQAQISLSQIGRMERGEINPTISTIYILSLALELSVAVLMDVDLPLPTKQTGR